MSLRAAFAFTPAESKRLIGRAVAALPEVRKALAEDLIVIAHGSTNVYVAEEILGPMARRRETFLSGQIINGVFCQTEPSEKGPMVVVERGRVVPPKPRPKVSCIFQGRTESELPSHFIRRPGMP